MIDKTIKNIKKKKYFNTLEGILTAKISKKNFTWFWREYLLFLVFPMYKRARYKNG